MAQKMCRGFQRVKDWNVTLSVTLVLSSLSVVSSFSDASSKFDPAAQAGALPAAPDWQGTKEFVLQVHEASGPSKGKVSQGFSPKPLRRLAAAASTGGPCSESSLLVMIRDYAPHCIEECPQICTPLGGLITAVMMGAEPMDLICQDYQIFRCMAKNAAVLNFCTPLLDAAKTYVGIDLPRSDEALLEACGVEDDQGGDDDEENSQMNSQSLSVQSAESNESLETNETDQNRTNETEITTEQTTGQSSSETPTTSTTEVASTETDSTNFTEAANQTSMVNASTSTEANEDNEDNETREENSPSTMRSTLPSTGAEKRES